MLKYKIKTNGLVPTKEILYDELYIEPQGKYISGVTSYDYNLIDGEYITVNTLYLQPIHPTMIKNITEHTLTNSLPIRTENVLRQGWFEIDDKRFYIEDGRVEISGLTYSLEDQLTYVSGNTTVPQIEFSGHTLSAITNIDSSGNTYYSNDEWQDVTKFTINKAQDIEILTDRIGCGDYIPYVRYSNNTYDILTSGDTRYIEVDGKIIYEKKLSYLEGYGLDNDTKEYVKSGYTEILLDDREVYFTLDDNTKLQVYYEWRETKEFSPYIFLYIDLQLANRIEDSQKHFIVEKRYNPIQKLMLNENNCIEFNGKEYPLDDTLVRFVVINGKEYEVFNYGQIIIDEIFVDVLFFKDNTKTYAVKVNNAIVDEKFEVKEYNTITIDNTRYLVKTNHIEFDELKSGATTNTRTQIDEKYIEYNGIEYYTLDLVVKNGNVCICKLHNMNLYETDNAKLRKYSNIIQDIVKSQDGYRTKLYVDTFHVGDLSTTPHKPTISIFKNDSYLSIPLLMDTEVANNLQQEMLVNSQFVDYEKNRRTNRIIDMEHEVYYPVKKNDDGTYTQVDKLIFDLHFRTRNLDDWTVIEDNFQHLDSKTITDYKSKASESESSDTNKDILYCNWNVFDYYQTDDDNDNSQNNWSSTHKHYQPSDLLYFLNFTDDDVYYQKSKIGKSFLRLMFYDSKDPLTQSLLSTSTIFMDEGKLFGKYCNTKSERYLRPFNSNEVLAISSTMSVRYEPCESADEVKATFDENLRLDSQIVVENKYETSTSSEGFYLYLFKEYVDIVNGLHPKTIYLRIQFNHAGTGKVVDMAFPFTYNGNCETDIKAIDFSNETMREEFKKGYDLGQEVYDHLFLPIQVVYDDNEKKYVYYLPKEIVKNDDNSMRFNLYELKVNNGI